MSIRKKILIDTDIGDDIDDAFAVLAAMALDFEIVGITTVFRNTEARARMAKRLLHAYGYGYEAVPVYAGFSSYTQDKEENTEHMWQFGQDLYIPEYAPDSVRPEDAVDFIIDCCRRYGKELAVIAIGPFCNIAKVIEKDPEALAMANQVAIMGGAYFKQYADWNVMCDVPAADVMYSQLPNLACIGADVTHRLFADRFLMDALRSETPCNAALEYLRSLFRQWQVTYPGNQLLLHDVAVVYYALNPDIFTMKRICVKVICQGYAKGFTLNIDAYGKASLNSAYENYPFDRKTLAASDVDMDQFYQLVHQNISKCMRHEKQD